MEDIIIREVYRSFGEKEVLHGFSARLHAGTITGLMAPSGSGKTTLLRILMGLDRPQRGEITGLDGLRVSAVFQEDRLLPTLTLEENLCLVSRTPALARQIGEELGLAEYFSHHPAALSGGQRRRGALGRALAFPCDALLMDEPFQGLDEESRKKAAQCILEHQEGRALLVISHEPKDAERLKARSITLESLMT